MLLKGAVSYHVETLEIHVSSTQDDTILVKSDLSGITIPPIFCGCLRKKSMHLKRLDDTTDIYDLLWKVTNTLYFNYRCYIAKEVQYGFLIRCRHLQI